MIPRPHGSPRRTAARARWQALSTAVVTFAVLGAALIGAGVFVLDWYQADIVSSAGFRVHAAKGLDLKADSFSVVAGAIGAIFGLLGLKSRVSRSAIAAVLLVAAGVTAASALYLMYGPPASSEQIDLFGLSVTAKVSLGIGGQVTLVGAVAVAIAGLLVAAGSWPAGRR